MELRTVGQNLIRVDAYSKVTGKALYPQDIYMEGMAYGKTLRSTKAHAYIKVDISAAEKVDGVLKVFTYKDLPEKNEYGVIFKDHQVFVSKKVKKIGEAIAFIVGETMKACQEGLEKIIVEYEELEAVFDPVEALKDGAPQVHDKSNEISHYKLRRGNIEEGIKKSDVIVEDIYSTHMVEHGFLQPEAGVSYVDDDGTLVLVVATQYPHYDREEIAINLGLREEEIRIINTNVGGAFGAREDITLQIHLCLAAYTLKRPVKCIYDREESFFAHCKRHPMVMKYRTGASKDGYLQFAEVEIFGDSGANASWATNVLRKAGVHANGPYIIPNVKVDTIAAYTNNPFTGAMRGFGATQVPVGHEQQMDRLAEKLEIDPIEFRMKNIFTKGCETSTGQIMLESVPVDRCIESLKNYVEEYKKMKTKTTNPLKRKGVGIGVSYYGTGYGNGFPDVSKARVRLLDRGRIGIFVGATEVGQGSKTILTQIGAEALNVETSSIEFICEDTKYMPDSGTAAASRQTYNTGNAIKIACENFLLEIKKIAQKELGLNTTVGLLLENDRIYLSFFPQKTITLNELSEKYKEKIEADGEFIAQTTQMDLETGQGAPYWPYTYSAMAELLEVEIKTGKVEVLESVFAQDTGRAVNPTLVEGQIEGGYAMGLGFTLFEDLNLENGFMKNHKFSKYLLPTSMDMIDIDTVIIEDPESTAPYGAKGIGEPVTIPVAPAILNAIYDATGVRVKDLPVTPERFFKILEENKI